MRGELSSVDAAARTTLGTACVSLCLPIHRAYAYLALAIVDFEHDRIDEALRHAELTWQHLGAEAPAKRPAPGLPPRQRYLAAEGELLRALDFPRVARQALDEPLTERELEVLRQLPGTQSIGEIAAALFLSTNTVKTHLRHIYRKLDAPHRRDAVRRGKELGLL